jgi:hypothetical protein
MIVIDLLLGMLNKGEKMGFPISITLKIIAPGQFFPSLEVF